MALKDLVAFYGRVGLVVTAFAFVIGIVVGPWVQKSRFADATVARKGDGPSLQQPKSLVLLASEKRD